jgi:hypothetical protein
MLDRGGDAVAKRTPILRLAQDCQQFARASELLGDRRQREVLSAVGRLTNSIRRKRRT